jgi:murein L,D-transpeptidase YcbB/YkuD
MTEIGLLIIGVLNPEPLNIHHFLPKKVLTAENGVSLKNHQSNNLIAYAQVTPPEFIQIAKTSPTHLANLSFRRQKIFEQLAQKYISRSSFELADASSIPRTGKRGVQVSTRYARTQSKPMPVISFGSSGTSVKVLQKLLIFNGYRISLDGVFGPITETAVKAFQNRRSLSTDGVVGQKTWSELTM